MVNHRLSGRRNHRRQLPLTSEVIETRVLLCATSVLAAGAVADGAMLTPDSDPNTIFVSSAGEGDQSLCDMYPVDAPLNGPDDALGSVLPEDASARMSVFLSALTTVETTGQFESSLIVDSWPAFDDEGNRISAGTIRNQIDDASYVSPDHVILHVGAGDPNDVATGLGLTDYKVVDGQTLYIPVPLSDGLDAFRFASSLDAGPGGSVEISLDDANGDPALSHVIDLQSTAIQVVDTPWEIPPFVRYLGGIADSGSAEDGTGEVPVDVVEDFSPFSGGVTTVETSGQFSSSLVVDMWPSYDENGILISTGTLRNLLDDSSYDSPDYVILHVGAGNPDDVAAGLGITDYKVVDGQTLYIPVPLSDGLDAFRLASSLAAGPGGTVEIRLISTSGDPDLSQVIDLQTTTVQIVDVPWEIPPFVLDFAGGIVDDGQASENTSGDGVVELDPPPSPDDVSDEDGTDVKTFEPGETNGDPVVLYDDPIPLFGNIQFDDSAIAVEGDTPHIRFFSVAPGGAELQRGGGAVASAAQVTAVPTTPALATSVPQVSTNANIPVVRNEENRLFGNAGNAGIGLPLVRTVGQVASVSAVASSLSKSVARNRSLSIGNRSSISSNDSLELDIDQLDPSLQGVGSSLGTLPENPPPETNTPQPSIDDVSSLSDIEVSTRNGQPVSPTPTVAQSRAAIDRFMSDYADDSFAV